MDRNAILSGYVTSFSFYSSTDPRATVEKVLKFSGNNFDIRKRADIKREVVVFKLLNGTTDYRLNDEKPSELNQRFQALVYIEQPDSHSLGVLHRQIKRKECPQPHWPPNHRDNPQYKQYLRENSENAE